MLTLALDTPTKLRCHKINQTGKHDKYRDDVNICINLINHYYVLLTLHLLQ